MSHTPGTVREQTLLAAYARCRAVGLARATALTAEGLTDDEALLRALVETKVDRVRILQHAIDHASAAIGRAATKRARRAMQRRALAR